MSERNKLIWGEILARAWRDEACKQQLLSNPKQVLTDAGMSVADDVELQVVQDTPTLRYLVLPIAPISGANLDESQLELVSGGTSGETTSQAAQLIMYQVEVESAQISTEVQTTAQVVTSLVS